MRILLTTTSGIGHLHSLVPLARAGQQAGLEIRIAAPASLGPTLAARGLPHLPLPDYGPEHLARVEDVMSRLGPPGPGAEVPMFREVFGWAKTASTLDAMRHAVSTWRPHLVLNEGAELSGPIAAEEADVAHATVAIGLRRTLETCIPYAAEGAAELATAIGLPPDPEARRSLEAPYVTLVPPTLETPRIVEAARVHRHRLTDIHVGDSGPDLRGADPLVWITFGTEAWRIPGLMDRIAPVVRTATEAMPHVRFLLTTGTSDAVVPTMPANVRVEPYVPQEAVLDACEMVLGHGGYNTTMAALAHGKPLVVMPLFATDQFETADRLAETGVAVSLHDPTPETLQQGLDRTLTDPSLTTAAETLADEMARLPTPGDALEAILDRGRLDR